MEYWGKLKISDMTTNHIKNCLNALQEDRIIITERIDACDKVYDEINYNESYIRAFENELKKRGEMLED